MEDNKELFYAEIIFFDIKKGYGFAQWDKDGISQKDIFIHFSDILCEGFKALYKQQRISFNLGVNKHGVVKAINVKVLHN